MISGIYEPLGFLQGQAEDFMALIYHHIFFDESGKHEADPLIAFSGVCSTGNRLSAFDAVWRSTLRYYELPSLHMKSVSRLSEDHGHMFKKGQTIDERTDALIPFADIINTHLEIGVIQAWSVRGYNSLSSAAKQILGGSNDPYFLAFVRGLLEIVKHIGEDGRINLICDDDIDTAWDCYNHYRTVGKVDHRIQKQAVSLSFANDKHFPALQAADMVAFLTRQEASQQFDGKPNIWRRLYDRLTIEPYAPLGVMRWYHMYAGAEMLAEFAKEANELAETKKADKHR